jgi:ABC-type uncharacterized transport system auxiliary subunit
MSGFSRLVAAVTLVAGALVLGGCATPATQQAMVGATPAPITVQHPYTVNVRTSGGSETSAMGSSEISDADLKTAIESSIRQSKVFKDVVQGLPAQYQLNVTLTQLDKPMFGGSFTVTMETSWSLIRTSDNAVVWRESIKGAHTATMGDAFLGVKRLQLAVEGAARKSIERGIAGIAAAPVGAAGQAMAASR